MNASTKVIPTCLGIFTSAALLLAPGSAHCDPGDPVEITTPFGIQMVQLPAGLLVMGQKDGQVDEQPMHEVNVKSFLIDKFEVTQREYERLMGTNPSRWKSPNNPAEQVRWSDAARYCNARSEEEGLQPCFDLVTWECDFSANGYRLPTEAEWEYACRAGTTTPRFFGTKLEKLKLFAWYKENSAGRPRPIGKKLPNPWGLHDMYGNVWEWCYDLYDVDYYQMSPANNPQGTETGATRVVRGGSWDSPADQCRSAIRYHEDPGYVDICFGYDVYGFRVVRNADNNADN